MSTLLSDQRHAWRWAAESTCAAQVMKIGQVIRDEFDGKKDLSGIGGVETGQDAAEFLLLGANSVQVRSAAVSQRFTLVLHKSAMHLICAVVLLCLYQYSRRDQEFDCLSAPSCKQEPEISNCLALVNHVAPMG